MVDLRVSQQVQEWQNEARLEIQRAYLLRALEKCVCRGSVPYDLLEMIQATKNTSLLWRWFNAALDGNSLDDFRAAVQ
ncbi:MAG TPA: hypothetical protein VN688_17125 [Gemmataceae bacterium]|nr:hypothetical protein [Gemmataceae bacterium]